MRLLFAAVPADEADVRPLDADVDQIAHRFLRPVVFVKHADDRLSHGTPRFRRFSVQPRCRFDAPGRNLNNSLPMAERSILIISGTNRPNSNTLRIANVIRQQYLDQQLAAEVFDVTDMPREVFEPTVYASKPPAFVQIQQRVYDSAGMHIVLPEYNGSFPGILKYFIDLLKFPESFDRKPV